MLGNGLELYNDMYGPENFCFSFSGYKFIVLNSNSQEVGHNGSLPDTIWLKQEAIGHIFSAENFYYIAYGTF
jgi:hypothetical protein